MAIITKQLAIVSLCTIIVIMFGNYYLLSKNSGNTITTVKTANIGDTSNIEQVASNIISNKIAKATKIALTYGQNCCTKAKRRFCDSAIERANVTKCFAYNQVIIDEPFYKKNKKILDSRKGAGFWLWKPYILNRLLNNDKFAEGTYFIYSDAGAKFISNVNIILQYMEENEAIYNGALFFGVGLPQKRFCKRDAFILQQCDNSTCYDAMQINGFCAFMKKCDFSRLLVSKWLEHCQDARILTDMPNTLGKPNLASFKAHRHDQAALTNIMIANGWKYHTRGGPLLDKVLRHDRYRI